MNIEGLRVVALEHVLSLPRGQAREMLMDEGLRARLELEFGRISRQYPIYFTRSQRASRIDFRLGGTNPVLIELAVRPKYGRSELYGSQNRSELEKLTRFPQSQAKLRVLLLIDLAAEAIPAQNLKPTYDVIGVGPGNFERHSVRVLYIHPELQYHFIWRPWVL